MISKVVLLLRAAAAIVGEGGACMPLSTPIITSLSCGRAASAWPLKAAAIIVLSLFTARGVSAFLPVRTSATVRASTSLYTRHLAPSARRLTGIRMASSSSGGSSTLLSHLGYLRQNTRLVLASKSPRRVEIFGLLGFTAGDSCFEVIPSTFAEDLDHAGFSSAADYAATNAEAKGREVAQQLFNRDKRDDKDKRTIIVVGSDTVVDLDGKILEKPGDTEEAFRMVKSLAGRKHLVHSGVAIFSTRAHTDAQGHTPAIKFAETTEVTFAALSDDEIRAYVSSGEPLDKAGAYGIQGLGGQMVTRVQGCYFNVMGFPMHRFSTHLAQLIQQGLA